jgi:hypothetical protein
VSNEIAHREENSLVTPTGQIIDLANTAEVALAYGDLQQMKRMIREVEGVLKGTLLAHSASIGKKTFELGENKVEIKGGTEKVFDAQGLKRALKEVGCPDERISEIVRETISYKVAAVEARQAAAANPDYAAAVEAHTTIEEKAPTVTVTRVGGERKREVTKSYARELTPAADPFDTLPWE